MVGVKVVCELTTYIPTTFIPTVGGYKGRSPKIAMIRPIKLYYFIGHNYHGHYFHAEPGTRFKKWPDWPEPDFRSYTVSNFKNSKSTLHCLTCSRLTSKNVHLLRVSTVAVSFAVSSLVWILRARLFVEEAVLYVLVLPS